MTSDLPYRALGIQVSKYFNYISDVPPAIRENTFCWPRLYVTNIRLLKTMKDSFSWTNSLSFNSHKS